MATKKAAQLESTLILGDRSARNPEPARSSDVAAAAANEVLAPGTQLDNYVIERKLGAGGMGVVYKAHDGLLDRTVALKILPPHFCENEGFVRRFANEARVQARLDSPYVVKLHALIEKSVGWVLAMEYLEGETLEQRLRRQGTLSVKEAVDVFAQASVGVEHIHHMGIVHQDLKPANIFITVDGRLKLVDFGVARLIDEQDPTKSGTMGTFLYMSPEQIKGRQIDYRSDIYTLGITLFEAVTGRLPFEGKTHYALMHAHVQENPPPPRKFRTEIPRELEKLILKAIAKDPDRRFQTIAEFRKALLRHRKVRSRQFQPAAAPPSGDNREARKRERSGSLVRDGVLLIGSVALALLLTGDYPNVETHVAAKDVASRTQTPEDRYTSLKKAWGNPSANE